MAALNIMPTTDTPSSGSSTVFDGHDTPSQGSESKDDSWSQSRNTKNVSGVDFDGVSLRTVTWCVQFNILLYSTCFWIQQASLPYLTERLNVDKMTYGYLQTAFAIAQLAGGPLFGRFGDLFGAKAALTLCYASGFATYGMLAMATNVEMLFISRALAVFLATMQGSQMVITDLTLPEKRADAIAKLGLIYGIGMVVGPFCGGILTDSLGPVPAAWAAALGSLASMFSILIFIPKHVKPVIKADQNVKNVFNIKLLIKLMAYPDALFLLSIKCIVGVPIGILQSMFAVIIKDTFDLPAKYNGFIMSYVGVVTMVVQGIGVGILTKKYCDMTLLKFGTIAAMIAYICLSQVTHVWLFCISLLPLIIGMTTMQIVISAALTKSVPSQDTGAMIGIGMACNSIIRIASPTLGGMVMESFGYPAIGYVGVCICAMVALLLFSIRQEKSKLN